MLVRFAALALCVSPNLVSARANAQVAGGVLSGTVTNDSGQALPNAQISLKNIDTSVSRVVTTDVAGFYRAPDLPPAS
jgi:hypothetical protein